MLSNKDFPWTEIFPNLTALCTEVPSELPIKFILNLHPKSRMYVTNTKDRLLLLKVLTFKYENYNCKRIST
jgi:hypothetical protein